MLLAVACVIPAVGCDTGARLGDGADAFGAGDVADRGVHDNDVNLNSASLNGWSLNGWSLNGWSLNGWSLNGWSLNGWSLNSMALSGSSFTAIQLVDGQPVSLSGADLIGSEIELERGGVPYRLRFDDIYKDPANPTGDVYFNDISVHDDATNTWSSLCLDAAGAPTQAIAIANYWDPITGDRIDEPSAVTFACRGAALAKCVEWGYRPWATVTDCSSSPCKQVSLANHHQACTRMVRADYCGIGVPNTLNGTPIDVYDRLWPRIQTKSVYNDDEQWAVEAEWGPDGALCMSKTTRLKLFSGKGNNHPDPQCRSALEKIKDCGKFKSTRPEARLATNYCSKWNSDPDECELDDED